MKRFGKKIIHRFKIIGGLSIWISPDTIELETNLTYFRNEACKNAKQW